MQRKDLTPVEKMCGDRCLRAFCRVVIECNQCKELKGLTDNEAIQVGYAVRGRARPSVLAARRASKHRLYLPWAMTESLVQSCVLTHARTHARTHAQRALPGAALIAHLLWTSTSELWHGQERA